MWKDTAVSCFKTLPKYLRAETEENHQVTQDNRRTGSELSCDLSGIKNGKPLNREVQWIILISPDDGDEGDPWNVDS
jgi:hypothetical protein